MEDTELDLHEIFLILRRRFKLILSMPIVAALTAGLVSYFLLTPIYSASTTLWVIKDDTAQLTYNDVLMSRNLTKTYAEVAKSRAVMADVIDSLGLVGITPEDLQEKLTVTPVKDTEILSFAVEDADPLMAAKLADGVAESFQAQIRSYMQVENVAVVDPAVVPLDPVKPRPLMNIAIAFVLGGMAAVGLAFLLEYMDTSIKSQEDLTRHVGLPVLGVIPVIEETSAEPAHRHRRVKQTETKTVVER